MRYLKILYFLVASTCPFFRSFSMADVLAGKVPAEAIRDRIVIIGSLAWIQARGRLWTLVLGVILLEFTYVHHWHLLAWLL